MPNNILRFGEIKLVVLQKINCILILIIPPDPTISITYCVGVLYAMVIKSTMQNSEILWTRANSRDMSNIKIKYEMQFTQCKSRAQWKIRDFYGHEQNRGIYLVLK